MSNISRELRNDDLILIGKITKTRGLRGQVKILSLTDYPQQFTQLEYALILKDGVYKRYQIAESRYIKKSPVVKFEGVESPEDAEKLVGGEVYIQRRQRAKLPANAYYFNQIEGSRVISIEGVEVGNLVDVYHLPASDVLVIDRQGKEVLIPFVEQLVLEVDIDKLVITVLDMPSLWEE